MILDNIVADKRLEVEARKASMSLQNLRLMALGLPAPLDFASVLRRNRVQLIAEVKKASPSKGVIRENFDPVEIALTYADHGASAISVLTESKYFQGSLDYLRNIRKAVGNRLPLLRKDFIFDPYQVYEARAYGADALLLIAAILSPKELSELLWLSHGLGIQCLVEVHKEELDVALKSKAKIIGINNRDLTTFEVNTDMTRRLRPLIPQDRIVVSESGIKSRNDMQNLAEWRVDAALVGEYLVSAPDIASRMKELI